MNLKVTEKLVYVLAGFIALTGIAVMLYQTRNGPAVGGDSVQYIIGAQNLIDGNGYSRLSGGNEVIPITGFPPVFSSVLALLGLLGFDLIDGARLLNMLLFSGSIFLVGILLHQATKSLWGMLIGSALILSSTTLLRIHGMILTEPLFLFLTLVTIYILIRYLDRPTPILLILLASVIGAATITRYVGLSLSATSVLSILVLSKSTWRRRVIDGAILMGISLVPLFLWFRRNASVGGSLTNRVLLFHPMRSDVLRGYFAEVLSWFVPRVLGLPRWIRNILVLIIALPVPIIFAVRDFRRGILKNRVDHSAIWYLPWILITFAVSYMAILVANSTLLDAGTTLSAVPRYLAPVFVAMIMVFTMIVHRLLKQVWESKLPIVMAFGYGAILVLLYAIQAYPQITQPDLIYLEYMRKRPGVVETLASIDPEASIITNNQEMVYLMAERPSYMWPIHFDQYRREEREDYQAQLDATIEKLNNGAVLVVFGWPVGTNELVFDILKTQRLETFLDATFLGYPEAQSK